MLPVVFISILTILRNCAVIAESILPSVSGIMNALCWFIKVLFSCFVLSWVFITEISVLILLYYYQGPAKNTNKFENSGFLRLLILKLFQVIKVIYEWVKHSLFQKRLQFSVWLFAKLM